MRTNGAVNPVLRQQRRVPGRQRVCIALLATAALGIALSATPARAQFYGLYLACEGSIIAADGQKKPADLTLAMRDNNETALIQSSNVLPVGQTVKYQATQEAYTVNYVMPGPRTRYWYDWYNGWIIGWYPNLEQLRKVELSISRITGKLGATLLNVRAETLGQLAMECTGKDVDELPKPKF